MELASHKPKNADHHEPREIDAAHVSSHSRERHEGDDRQRHDQRAPDTPAPCRPRYAPQISTPAQTNSAAKEMPGKAQR